MSLEDYKKLTCPKCNADWLSLELEDYGYHCKKCGNFLRRDDKYYEDFKIFIATRNQKGAVEINGKKWAVSSRVPFPHEMALNKSIQPTPSATDD